MEFLAGTQNYNIPGVNKLASTALFMAKLLERSYRKSDQGPFPTGVSPPIIKSAEGDILKERDA